MAQDNGVVDIRPDSMLAFFNGKVNAPASRVNDMVDSSTGEVVGYKIWFRVDGLLYFGSAALEILTPENPDHTPDPDSLEQLLPGVDCVEISRYGLSYSVRGKADAMIRTLSSLNTGDRIQALVSLAYQNRGNLPGFGACYIRQFKVLESAPAAPKVRYSLT